ncbi:glycosyltransferase [Namhaeicola litoreus]|uniref:Glycosyltransferase n=1 Tax=Namhaeicola litoreus TaxID=1052145 RepID=A0ABW3Y611_9FLAO
MKRGKLFVIALVWPEPNATAAGIRMTQLLELFKHMNYKIYYGATSAFNDASAALQELGAEVLKIESNNKSFDEIIHKINPDIVLFDRFIAEEQFGWRVDEICPKAMKILDTEDLHFLRETRKKISSDKNLIIEIKQNDLAKREVASMLRSDLSLLISSFELELLVNELKIDETLLHYIPFLPEALSLKNLEEMPGFNERQHFLSIGNFMHQPNRDAVFLLHDEIWPKVRKELPDADLLVCGAYADDQIKKLHNKKNGFLVYGHIQSAEEIFKHTRVCLAPLQFGAGQKGKLLDSMRFGTPNITTPIGVEGMKNDLPWNGYITDDWEEFVNRSVDLYTDQSAWETAQKNGFTILEKSFDKQKNTEAFRLKIEFTLTHLEEIRTANFFGAMLKLHNSKSTKYLSKWIEEKNKKLYDV